MRHAGAVALQIRMTDKDPLQDFLKVVQAGKIYGPYVTRQSGLVNPRWKPNYLWSVRGNEAKRVLTVLLPRLGKRRALRAKGVLHDEKV